MEISISFVETVAAFEDLDRFCADAKCFSGKSKRFLSKDSTLLNGDLGRSRGDLVEIL